MNFKKFFEKAAESGITESEISYSRSTSFSVSLFRGEIDNSRSSSRSSVLARGVYKGKFGLCTTEKDDRTTIDYLISGIRETAEIVESDEEPILFKGSEKYHKGTVFNKDLENVTPEDALKLLHQLEDKLRSGDEKVSEVRVGFGKSSGESVLANSYGLCLKSKGNSYSIYGSVVMKKGDEIKSAYDSTFDNDFSKIDVDKMAKKILDEANAQFDGVAVESGKYNVVMKNGCVGDLLGKLISNVSSKETQKHSSRFEGKEGEKVLSSKLTVKELPLTKNIHFSYYDSEGVAKENKTVIDKGVLKTLFYNLETAKAAGVKSTANASRNGSKMGISYSSLYIKPGKLSEDELFAKIKDGIYITDLAGMHSGLNAKSGSFSLQAQGFLIRDGKKSSPLQLFTVGGNLFDMFSNILAVGSNLELQNNSYQVPSIAFSGLSVSC